MNKLLTSCIAVAAFAGMATTAFGQSPRRNVLIEEFTSATCDPCVKASENLNKILADPQYRGSVFSIRYHMNTPHPNDPYYRANEGDVNARLSFYGMDDASTQSIPKSVINGGREVPPTDEVALRTAINSELLEIADNAANIKVDQTIEGSTATVTVKVTAGNGGLSGAKLTAAVVEGYISNPGITTSLTFSNGETEFHDVMRQIIYLNDGQSLSQEPGQVKTYTATFTVKPDWQPSQIHVVAWAQDGFDQQILQVGSSEVILGVEDPAAVAGNFSLGNAIPNPVRDAATFSYSLATPAQVTVEVRDLTGRLVTTLNEGRRETGTYDAWLDLSGVPAGVYAYTVQAGSNRATKMLTVVR